MSRMKERRVFLFEQIVIFSEPLDKKRGFSMPSFLYKNSIKVPSYRLLLAGVCNFTYCCITLYPCPHAAVLKSWRWFLFHCF